ncbi:MAG: GGDEF domain-containing protein [Actinomycetota bacterium]
MTTAQASGPQTHRRTDPLSREALFRQVGCLVGAVLLGFLSMAARQVGPDRSGDILQASALAALTIGAINLVPWDRLPAVLHRVLPFVYLLVAFMTREATGGADSTYVQLAMLPVLWVAVYGTALELGLAMAGMALVLAIPMFSPATADDWVRVTAITSIGGSIGFVLNRFFTQLRSQTNRLRLLAGTDPLTGAANRRAWDEELVRALTWAGHERMPVTVALLDLDDFKAYNDRRGHQAGDLLLKEVSAAWQAILRASDLLGRIGGDEFAVLLPGCSLETGAAIAERLKGAVPSARCSIGLAEWDGRESDHGLLARADAALYEAKERGRGRVVFVNDTAAAGDGSDAA